MRKQSRNSGNWLIHPYIWVPITPVNLLPAQLNSHHWPGEYTKHLHPATSIPFSLSSRMLSLSLQNCGSTSGYKRLLLLQAPPDRHRGREPRSEESQHIANGPRTTIPGPPPPITYSPTHVSQFSSSSFEQWFPYSEKHAGSTLIEPQSSISACLSQRQLEVFLPIATFSEQTLRSIAVLQSMDHRRYDEAPDVIRHQPPMV